MPDDRGPVQFRPELLDRLERVTKVKPGDGRLIAVRDPAGNQVVAQVHVEIGSGFVVILPDGQLMPVRIADAQPADGPFKPADPDAMAAALAQGKLKGFRTSQTKRYLYVYNTSNVFFKGTSRILETMYPGLFAFCKKQGLKVHDPPTPLVVIMFRTEDEFRKYKAVPQGVAAYYDQVTNHVVMYEQSELVERAPEIAVKEAISTVAHEGTHQILHNIGVQQRLSRWPMWISEGLAEYFAPTSVDQRVRWKGAGQVNDLRMWELDRYLLIKQVKADRQRDTVQQTISARGLTSTGYASSWALTHYLAEKRKKAFYEFFQEVSKMGPLETADDNGVPLFRKHFPDELAKLDGALFAHLQSLPYVDPIANQTHYVVMYVVGSGTLRGLSVVTSLSDASRWRDQTLLRMSASMRSQARFDVKAFPNEAAAERFAATW